MDYAITMHPSGLSVLDGFLLSLGKVVNLSDAIKHPLLADQTNSSNLELSAIQSKLVLFAFLIKARLSTHSPKPESPQIVRELSCLALRQPANKITLLH